MIAAREWTLKEPGGENENGNLRYVIWFGNYDNCIGAVFYRIEMSREHKRIKNMLKALAFLFHMDSLQNHK